MFLSVGEPLIPPQSSNMAFFPPAAQVHVAVSHSKVKLYVDCKKISEKPINTLGSISTAGFIMLGKVTRTRGPRSGSVPVSAGMCWGWLGWAHGQESHLSLV